MSDATFWRTETLHPLTLHFPIALLLLATLTKLVAFFAKADTPFWDRAGSYLLYLGCLTAWLSIYTGDIAEGEVARRLCDPTVLKDHEIAAYNLAYFFSAATLLNLGLRMHLLKVYSKFIRLAIILLMITGSGFLVYAGHLGAHVVYQQAGGVNVPSADCVGF